jgi:hypothetical protein
MTGVTNQPRFFSLFRSRLRCCLASSLKTTSFGIFSTVLSVLSIRSEGVRPVISDAGSGFIASALPQLQLAFSRSVRGLCLCQRPSRLSLLRHGTDLFRSGFAARLSPSFAPHENCGGSVLITTLPLRLSSGFSKGVPSMCHRWLARLRAECFFRQNQACEPILDLVSLPPG